MVRSPTEVMNEPQCYRNTALNQFRVYMGIIYPSPATLLLCWSTLYSLLKERLEQYLVNGFELYEVTLLLFVCGVSSRYDDVIIPSLWWRTYMWDTVTPTGQCTFNFISAGVDAIGGVPYRRAFFNITQWGFLFTSMYCLAPVDVRLYQTIYLS